MDETEKFSIEVANNVHRQGADRDLKGLSNIWIREVDRHNYYYNFTWLGLPIIQIPQDIIAMQEIIWRVRPDVIVETGIARGGSLAFYASMLELLGGGEAVGIDIDIRPHNRRAIEAHPMSKRIRMIEGSSTDDAVVRQVYGLAEGKRVLVVLDSNHTHGHVLKELQIYSPLVAKGSYIVVFDTGIEDMPEGPATGRPWRKGDNPKTAVHEFLRSDGRFEIDRDVEDKLLITGCPDGFLKCVKDR
jgi:cephalosporin hydroxylase